MTLKSITYLFLNKRTVIGNSCVKSQLSLESTHVPRHVLHTWHVFCAVVALFLYVLSPSEARPPPTGVKLHGTSVCHSSSHNPKPIFLAVLLRLTCLATDKRRCGKLARRACLVFPPTLVSMGDYLVPYSGQIVASLVPVHVLDGPAYLGALFYPSLELVTFLSYYFGLFLIHHMVKAGHMVCDLCISCTYNLLEDLSKILANFFSASFWCSSTHTPTM